MQQNRKLKYGYFICIYSSRGNGISPGAEEEQSANWATDSLLFSVHKIGADQLVKKVTEIVIN